MAAIRTKDFIERWEAHRDNLVRSTPVPKETEAVKRARIAKLEANSEEWFAYYFPNYYTSPSANFHRQATRRVIKNNRWYEVRKWARDLAKSTPWNDGGSLHGHDREGQELPFGIQLVRQCRRVADALHGQPRKQCPPDLRLWQAGWFSPMGNGRLCHPQGCIFSLHWCGAVTAWYTQRGSPARRDPDRRYRHGRALPQ